MSLRSLCQIGFTYAVTLEATDARDDAADATDFDDAEAAPFEVAVPLDAADEAAAVALEDTLSGNLVKVAVVVKVMCYKDIRQGWSMHESIGETHISRANCLGEGFCRRSIGGIAGQEDTLCRRINE